MADTPLPARRLYRLTGGPRARARAVSPAQVALALVVAAALLLLALPHGALAFSDVPAGHPHAVAIDDLAARTIIGGYADGTFGPAKPVWRQHFAKMIVLTMDLPVSEGDVCPYADVSKPKDDLYPDNYIAVAAANSITKGYADGRFGPYDDISRAQVVTMVVRAAENLRPGTLAQPPAGYPGPWPSLGDPHGANARTAAHNGLLAGLGGAQGAAGLDPWGKMPRGEVAQVLYNLLGTLGGGPGPDPGVNPLDVTVSTDGGRTAKAVISASGGTLTATGADGVVYKLVLPADALMSDEEIAMTPVTALGGAPLSGGLVGGVTLEPDGLRLLAPATLTITAPAAIAREGLELTGWGTLGDGQDFHLYPAEMGTSSATLTLMHFSGYGAGRGTKAELAAHASGRKPRSSGARMSQELSAGELNLFVDGMRRWAARIVAAGESSTLATLASVLGEYDNWRFMAVDPGLTDAARRQIRAMEGEVVDAVSWSVAKAPSQVAYACEHGTPDPKHGLMLLQLKWWAAGRPEILAALPQDWNVSLGKAVSDCLTFGVDLRSRVVDGVRDSQQVMWVELTLTYQGVENGYAKMAGAREVSDRWEEPPDPGVSNWRVVAPRRNVRALYFIKLSTWRSGLAGDIDGSLPFTDYLYIDPDITGEKPFYVLYNIGEVHFEYERANFTDIAWTLEQSLLVQLAAPKRPAGYLDMYLEFDSFDRHSHGGIIWSGSRKNSRQYLYDEESSFAVHHLPRH